MTKKLFVLISDGGDGSYSNHYTFNEAFIARLHEKDKNGELDYDSLGCDGDGFHYDTLNVPDECTLESLGIRYDAARNFNEDDEDNL